MTANARETEKEGITNKKLLESTNQFISCFSTELQNSDSKTTSLSAKSKHSIQYKKEKSES
jgi:hypothetical protein